MTVPASLLDERQGPVTIFRLNRPDRHNALNSNVLELLGRAVARSQEDRATRAVIITAAGEKAFCAGADLDEIAAMDADQAQEMIALGQRVLRLIERSRVPIISAVNGLALGGGFELVLASTVPVLSTTASLGLPEAGLGLIPGFGGTQRLLRAVGLPIAAHVILAGHRIDAARAYELSLTPVPPVGPDQLLDAALDVANAIAAKGPRATHAIMTAFDLGRDASLEAGLQAEAGLAALAVAGEESTEGVQAFLEHRAARFPELAGPR